MDLSNMKNAQRLAYIVNTSLTIFVIGMIFEFFFQKVDLMYYVTCIALGYYVIAYIFIYQKKLDMYVFTVYLVIVVYMCIATICLGTDYGFQLYCMSLIPLIFYIDYMATKLHTRKTNPLFFCCFIGLAYIFSTGYSVYRGPIYVIDDLTASIFLAINSTWVFFFLISYSLFMTRLIKTTEADLVKMAQVDKLTGIYNRHYMLKQLENFQKTGLSGRWIAMMDIDDFKKFNDTYGHNCGDHVLVHLSELISEFCQDCTYARWGGEEFLISSKVKNSNWDILESLRKNVESEIFLYDNKELHVTITIGVCEYQQGQTIDQWIKSADELLYEGKKFGKNRVITKGSV